MLVTGAQLDALFSPCEINATARVYRTEAIIFDAMGHDMMPEPEWADPAGAFLEWLDGAIPHDH